MTSNVGFDEINVGFNKNNSNLSKLKEYFSLPFINRIDDIVKFNQLKEEDILKIIQLKIDALIGKYKDKIKVKIEKEVLQEILKLSNYEEFGARKIEKIIKNKLENIILDKLIIGRKSVNIKSIEYIANT